MDDPTSTYYQPPFCSRPRCGAPVTTQSVLVNTQKESIMTVGGQNLMPSRVEEPFMWCCQCANFRGEGRDQDPECVHCLNSEENRCKEWYVKMWLVILLLSCFGRLDVLRRGSLTSEQPQIHSDQGMND